MTDSNRRVIRRRTVLQGAAVGAIAGLGTAVVSAQEETGTEIELGGRVSGWVGQSPEAIEDDRNPTLELIEGEAYTVTWENLDGDPHNFVIVDEDSEERFVETEIISDSGATQEVEFTAEAEMTEYFCGPHRTSMNGPIEVGDEGFAEESEETDDPIGDGPTVGLEAVAEGLADPVDFQVADEDADRRFIVDQTGQIYVHGPDGLEGEPFLDVADRMVELEEGDFDERGLLGLAFHPDFAENGRFYVRYSAPPTDDVPDDWSHTFVLAEFETVDDDNAEADPDSEERILEIPEPQFNHDAGPIAFGPDGYLYVATGDGGGANDADEGHVDDWYAENEGGNGQDTSENLLGGILRIDVDGEGDDRPYGIPEDNPLVDEEDHLDEYFAWGLRNPWGMSITADGDLLVADAGQELYESVNHVERGGNYSWNVKEGTHCFSTETPEEPPEECPDETPEDVRGGEPLRDPVIEYPHEIDGEPVGTTVIGGHLYEGDEVDELEGTYVFGDWSVDGVGPGTLFLARPPENWPDDEAADDETDGDDADDEPDGDDFFIDPPGTEDEENATRTEDDLWPIEALEVEVAGEGDDGDEPIAADGELNRLVYGFGRDADGELYVLTSSDPSVGGESGAVHRIVPQERSVH